MTIFKITIVLGSILGLFLFFQHSFAFVISNTDDNFSDCFVGAEYPALGWVSGYASNRSIFYIYSNQGFNINNLKVKLSYYGGQWIYSGNIKVLVINKNGQNLHSGGIFPSDWQDFIVASSTINGVFNDINTFYFNNEFIPPGYTYFYFYIPGNSGGVNRVGFGFYGNNSTPEFRVYGEYRYDDELTNGSFYLSQATYGAKVHCYIINASPPEYVNFLYPQNNNTYNQQQLNNFWTINFKFSTSTDFSLRALVRWCNVDAPVGCNDNNLYIIDDKVLGSSLYFSDNEWSTNIPFQGIFYNGTYKAQACLAKDNFLLSPFLCSDVITFYVQDVNLSNFTTSTPYQINLEGVCTPPQGGFLDYPVDNITYAFCRAITFLFIPNETQQNDIKNKFLNLSNEVKNKPPIGYFYKIKDLFNFTTTTTSTLISTSTYNKFSDIFNPLKNGIKIILFLAVGVFVIKKISNIFI